MLGQIRPPSGAKLAKEHDRKAKALQKHYKDSKSNVRPHNIAVGDMILKQRKQNKSTTPYDPEP